MARHEHKFTSSALFNPAGKVTSSVSAAGRDGLVAITIQQGIYPPAEMKVSADDAGKIASVISRAAINAKGR